MKKKQLYYLLGRYEVILDQISQLESYDGSRAAVMASRALADSEWIKHINEMREVREALDE